MNHQPINWNEIKLVVFDVDGTLYCQHKLRMQIAWDLLHNITQTRSLRILSVIKTYRQIRERLGTQEVFNFVPQLLAETEKKTGVTEESILAIVHEWIEVRPLPYLISCRFSGLTELFAGLKRNGKNIGIFSDYPARQKLNSLGLAADYIVSAQDDLIGFLKPNPKGLEYLMYEAKVKAEETLLIGDRVERDGFAAERMGVRCLIRSRKLMQEWQTFNAFNDPIFLPMLQN